MGLETAGIFCKRKMPRTPISSMASPITSFSEPQDQSQGKNASIVDIDKFSTLFSPATPRASPILGPVDGVAVMMNAKPYSRPRSYHHDRRDILGSDSELSSFVSVSAAEDPLSLLGFAIPPPVEAASLSADVRDGDLSRKSSSLRFFGRFAQEAKEAAERNKRGVLDELLLHEDDPLYWLKDQDHELGFTSNDNIWPPSQPTEREGETLVPEQSRESLEIHPEASSSLQDLDHDFFTSKPVHNAGSSPPTTDLATTMPHHSPTRSPTHPAPPTLAPPVASTSSVSSTPAGEVTDPLSNSGTHEGYHTTHRSSSYQTLSGLSSRWMSSLLSKSSTGNSSSSNSPVTSGHLRPPSLETLFNVEASTSVSSKSRSRSSDPHPRIVNHAHTLPSTPAVRISHGTPFGHQHPRTSPFASHFYTPPSGAPGFAGERYDWDKGFSTELKLEIERENHREGDTGLEHAPDEVVRGRQVREMVDVGRGENRAGGGEENEREPGHRREAGSGNGHGHVVGVGEFMEKKSGRVQLDGRKAMTTPVLDVEVADMIRPHFPALARLPHKWTLLYSLDQHGISLNTLYTRCEFSPPRLEAPSPQGALLVLKDAGEALFGVWMGEGGVHPSRGKGYYGSGESFMWSYVGGKFEVFKWTGRNDYVALCEPEFISFGGGDGQYGLYLDESLLDGSSAPCPTFGNDPLCSPGPRKAGAVKFECVGLEVWGVGP